MNIQKEKQKDIHNELIYISMTHWLIFSEPLLQNSEMLSKIFTQQISEDAFVL